jgi:hypothetical protein
MPSEYAQYEYSRILFTTLQAAMMLMIPAVDGTDAACSQARRSSESGMACMPEGAQPTGRRSGLRNVNC